MRVIKHIINWTVWTIVSLYALVMITIHLPWVQRQLGNQVAQAVADKLGTTVSVGRVDLGFLNRLIIDNVVVHDQQDKPMLEAARLTAKVELAPLAAGRISISSAQIFGVQLNLSRPTADAPANFQFVLDSLASKDTTTQAPLNLHVNSFIMRNGTVRYDQLDAPQTAGRLNPRHLLISNISAHIILKELRDDSLSVNIKRLACQEQSGADVKRLTLRLTAGNHNASLRDFALQMPNTAIRLDSVSATYDRNRFMESLRLKGSVTDTHIMPSDFRFLFDKLKNYQHNLALTTHFDYRERTLNIPDFLLTSDKGDVALQASGDLRHPVYGKDVWHLRVDRMDVAGETLDFVSKNMAAMPAEVLRLGDLQLRGDFGGDAEGTLYAQANVATGIGNADLSLRLKEDKHYTGNIATDGADLGRLLDNDKLGLVAANVDISGAGDRQMAVKGLVDRLEYGGDSYQNISLDASYNASRLTGWAQIDDPKVAARLEMALQATTLNNAVGTISLNNLTLPDKDYHLDYLRLESGFENGRHFVTLNSDFAHADLSGDFDYTTLAQGVANVIGSRLPTLPGLPPLTKATRNNFALQLTLGKTDWLEKLLGIKVDIQQPVSLSATVDDPAKQLMLSLQAPAFTYNDKQYTGGDVRISSPQDTLFLQAAISSTQQQGRPLDLRLKGNAVDNNLMLTLNWDNNNSEKPLSGVLNATSRLYLNAAGKPEAHVSVLPSNVVIENSLWQIEPSDILYSADRLLVDHFSVHNRDQYIVVDGTASKQAADTVRIDLNDIEVAYILDLVGFDAVDFSGQASGQAVLTSAFNQPDAYANLTVNDFKFEHGRMGTLTARVDWNKHDQQIDISATANDGPEAQTYINGYVSPEKNYIDLGIAAHGTYLDFMHSFTKSFISSITGHGQGRLRLAGPLSAINLTGGLTVDGEATITPLNTTYQLRRDSVTFVYNEILLDSLTLYDRYDNVAYLSGAVHHRDLTNLSLDLHVATDRLLGYDFRDFGDQSFYGTVFASGDVDISMHGDDVNINCNVTPLENTTFVYNADNPDAISNQEFITWRKDEEQKAKSEEPTPSTTNIYMTFLINATPNGTMRLLMDAKTGDYITLNGNGTIQATYYNKGTFQMQGTYTVESGTYDVTIQQIINKKFQFQPGGTIVFAGDPYSAALNLQALYTVNGVSLSDLQLGNTFSSNTVRVNCLMNIGGQPSAPQVTFDLDLPNVNADEKQMVRSLLSSQQEMNQQVLYLLGIGRFYSQGQNNATQQQSQQDQTTLAMQSFLSGTLSTQINNVINQIVKNDDWNFGANISTGTEGWNNAEYEGIVAGRMLNNRLLINGQFGYRDNATQASPSFIGDFDVSYLLLPNGNLALKVYNQTNDRYFTRSSLNTQGLGILMKKDFNTLSDLFGIKSGNHKKGAAEAAPPVKTTEAPPSSKAPETAH